MVKVKPSVIKVKCLIFCIVICVGESVFHRLRSTIVTALFTSSTSKWRHAEIVFTDYHGDSVNVTCPVLRRKKMTETNFYLGCAVATALWQRRLALSMERVNFQFSTPTESTPSTIHQNICHRWLRRRPLRLCQIRYIYPFTTQGASGHMGKIETKLFLFLPLFRNSSTGQTIRQRILTHNGSNDADLRNDMPLWNFFHTASHLGG